MMSVTHAIYAKKIAEHIKLMYGIKLRKYNLIYGSIKPDMSVFFSKIPHYFNESLDILCLNINSLIDSTDNKREIETMAFARELGVVLHYITDYFCRAHNDINGKKHPTNYKHIVYEQRFQNKLKSYELDEFREKAAISIDTDLEHIYENSLKTYISKKHNKYMKEAGKMVLYNPLYRNRMLDMEYSFCMSTVVATYIIDKIMQK